MSMGWQLKSLAIMCMLAGAARIVFSLLPWEDNRADLEMIALLINLGTLLGLSAFYIPRADKLKALGFMGFIITFSGLAIITGVDGEAFGFDVYQVGSMIIGVGLLVFSIALLLVNLARISALSWILMIAIQAAFMGISLGNVGFMLAGILYGIGFIALGWSTYRSQSVVRN